MYQAIYRKYRPDTFDKVIGQSEIVSVLKNQVMNNQLGHAYIFSGTRGTGKTSCAKILSRAVNCLNPIDGNPCNECINCKSILGDTTMDVVEMDAASNRRIDDIRDLRDKVIYPPALLKYKVYIIDEAHMITNEGFNALLKIMEEPPSHLIFILATTELEKIPQTILSRCQRFDFNRIDREGITESIKYITNDLNVTIEEEAVEMIARAADGAMRDAQSILDQVLASSGNHVTTDLVASIIGTVKSDEIFELVDRVINGSQAEALKILENVFESGIDSGEFISSLLDHYRDLLLAKTVPERLFGYEKETVNRFVNQARDLEIGRIVDSIEIILDATSQMRLSELTRIIAQITVVKLIDQVDRKSLLSRIEKLEAELIKLKDGVQVNAESNTVLNKVETKSEVKAIKDPAASKRTEHVNTEVISKTQDNSNSDSSPKENIVDADESIDDNSVIDEVDQVLKAFLPEWDDYVADATAKNPFWRFWINSLRPVNLENDKLTLYVPKDESIAYQKANDLKSELKEGLNSFINKKYEIIITNESAADEKSDEEIDETFKLIADLFGADNVDKI